MPSGVILAGGRSTRLGVPKASTLVGGMPMIERVARAVRAVCDEIVVVGGDVRVDGARYVADASGLGPIAGLAAGLADASHARCVVLACDMPFADTSVLRELLRIDAADAVVPLSADGRAQPLHAVYSRHVSATALRLLDAGVLRMTDLLDAITVRYVNDLDERSWWNVNTRSDLARARARCPEVP